MLVQTDLTSYGKKNPSRQIWANLKKTKPKTETEKRTKTKTKTKTNTKTQNKTKKNREKYKDKDQMPCLVLLARKPPDKTNVS